MYGRPPMPPTSGGALAATGASMMLGGIGYAWMAVAILVIVGTVLTLAKFGPRLALEPVRTPGKTKPRVRLTFNGRPTQLRDIPSKFRKRN